MQNNSEILLKVENLCQYFKMGKSELKAVNDVSFDIKRGEVFGLVGESGCGKTTTGRSIIKLYDITGGNIIFKGVRIGAGKRSYQDAIAKARADSIIFFVTLALLMLNNLIDNEDGKKLREKRKRRAVAE